jgi:hypothetical protein
MQFVPADANHTAQMKALLKQSQSLSLGALIGFILTHKDLDLSGHQPADGAAATGGQDFGFPDRLPGEADG